VAHGTTNWLIVSFGPIVLAAVVSGESFSAAASCPKCSQCESRSAEAGSVNLANELGSRVADRPSDFPSPVPAGTMMTDRAAPPCASRGLAALLPWHRCQPTPVATGGAKAGRNPIPTPAPQYSPSPFHPVPTRPVFSPRGFDPLFIPGYEHPVERPATTPEVVPPGETIPVPSSNGTVQSPVPFAAPPKPGTGWEIPDEPPPAPLPDAILSSRTPRSNGLTSESPGLPGRMIALPSGNAYSSSLPATGSDGRRSSVPAGPPSLPGIPGQLPSAARVGPLNAGSWIFKARPTEPLAQHAQPQPILEVERPQAERPSRR